MALPSSVDVVLQGSGSLPGPAFWIVWLALVIIVIGGVWRTFEKAGQPGWASLIPFYNFYIMLKIGDNEWWWLLALFVPILNFYAMYKIFAGVAKAFGKGIGWALGLWFLSIVFWPLLGFGDYEYQGPPA